MPQRIADVFDVKAYLTKHGLYFNKKNYLPKFPHEKCLNFPKGCDLFNCAMPMTSVIIPTFNRAAMLKEAIASVLAQDARDFEVIVVDDGSTDDTVAVLAEYPTPPVRVVHQVRQGVSAARNAGIKEAAGSLIAFLDSDDLWLPGKLAAQVAFFEDHPEAMICQTDEIWLRNGTRVNPKKRHMKPQGMIFDRCVELCLVSPSAVMMRRALFDTVGLFDEQMPACEDYDLWLRICSRFPIYLIDRPLTIKRGGHRDQLSRTPGLDKFRIYALVKILAQPAETGLNTAQRHTAIRALIRKCGIYAGGCLKRGRRDEAEAYLRLKKNFEKELAGGTLSAYGKYDPGSAIQR